MSSIKGDPNMIVGRLCRTSAFIVGKGMEVQSTPLKAPNCGPYEVELEKGKMYFICVCGHSRRQPYCDGSHARTKFRPVPFVPTETRVHLVCDCKYREGEGCARGLHPELEW